MLLLLLSIQPAACADIYAAPREIVVGSRLDALIAAAAPGESVSGAEGFLPAGIQLVPEVTDTALNVYLRGNPEEAGDFDCILTLTDGTSAMITLHVVPDAPVVSCTGDVECALNEDVLLAVNARSLSGSTLDYQWYYSLSGISSNGTALRGETAPICRVGTDYPGTRHYYCVVTNTDNGVSASTVSDIIAVTVRDGSDVSSDGELPASADRAMPPAGDNSGIGQIIFDGDDPGTVQFGTGGTQATGTDPYGMNPYGTQTYGTDPYGTQTYGTDPYGTQTYGTYPYGTQTYGTDPYGTQTYGNFPYGTQPYATDPYGQNGNATIFGGNQQNQPEIIVGIELASPPTKIRYTVGEWLDPTGLVVRAVSNLGVQREIDVNSGLICPQMQFNALGQQEVTVTYGSFTTSFKVTVEEPERPVTLTVMTMPNKVTYRVNESLDTTGLVLRQITNRQNAQEIYSGFTCSPTQLTVVGRQEITVSYADMTCRFTVTVTDIPQETAPGVTGTAATTPYPVSVPANGITGPASSPTPTPIPVSTPRAAIYGAHQPAMGTTLISIIVITAVFALLVLILYVFLMKGRSSKRK